MISSNVTLKQKEAVLDDYYEMERKEIMSQPPSEESTSRLISHFMERFNLSPDQFREMAKKSFEKKGINCEPTIDQPQEKANQK